MGTTTAAVAAVMQPIIDDAQELVLWAIGGVTLVAIILLGAGYVYRLIKRHVTGRKI